MPRTSALEGLAQTCVQYGWRMRLLTENSPVQLAYLEVRGRRVDGERELLAKTPVTFWTMDEACAEIAVALEAQGLLA